MMRSDEVQGSRSPKRHRSAKVSSGLPSPALSREHRLARAVSKGMARLCSCSRIRPMPGGFSSEEAQYAAGDEVTLEVEGVVDGGMCGEEALR